jgi:hypothetical protein
MSQQRINEFDDKSAKMIALITFVGVFIISYMFV